MKFEYTKVYNIESALRGARNPKDSWELSDSGYCKDMFICMNEMDFKCTNQNIDSCFVIGERDMKLAQALIKAGKEHRKFLRQIIVSVDITAPRFWWSEFDTYKIGVTANSCSTMHKLHAYPITFEMFEIDGLLMDDCIFKVIEQLEALRQQYNKTKDITWLRAMKQRLPESFLQKRTVTMNYEVLYEIVRQRSNHRLLEWHSEMMEWIRSLPYAKEFLFNYSVKEGD